MNWHHISTTEEVDRLSEQSFQKPQVIFKHSTRCMISSMIRKRLEREDAPENADFNFLDLIANRTTSNYISEKFSVHHESPQILLIKNGECTYDESHNGISMQELEEQL